MKVLTTLLAISISIVSIGQTVLLKQTVPEDFAEIDNNFGPNRGFFYYPYFGVGWHIGGISHLDEDHIDIIHGKSFELKSGTREHFKLNNLLALGLDFDLSLSSHRVKVGDPVGISPELIKEKYVFYKVGASGYLQINFKPRRGNQLGSYLDLGGFANYNFGRRHVTHWEYTNGDITKAIGKKLDNIERLEYGPLVRVGKNTWAIYTKYRVSNIFSSDFYTELPRLTFGLEFFPGNV